METKKMIGSRIKAIRKREKLTQEKLAEKMDINSKYLSSIERGLENPTLDTLINLSESLEVEMDEFFTHIEIEDPAKRKTMIISLLDKASADQLKLAYKILSAIIG